MRELMIVVALVSWLSGTQQTMEREALVIAQRASVNDLDESLPNAPFSSWFEKVVGEKSGVIWQLGECGQPALDSTLASTQDMPQSESGDIDACVEANAILPEGLKVVVMIKVGSFKRGVAKNPGFNFAMIENEGDLYLIKRLSDLPLRLRSLTDPEGNPLFLPEVLLLPRVFVPTTLLSRVPAEAKTGLIPVRVFEDNGSPPPPPRASNSYNNADPVYKIGGREEKGAITWGTAVTRVQPRYPPAAKKFSASGSVEVRITISEIGRVIEAKAVDGHPLLKAAAEEAARQWVFKPTTLKGIPMATQQVLTFVFKAPQ